MAYTNNNTTQTMKLPPKDAQLQGVNPINSKHNLKLKIEMLKRKPPRARAQL
jgi:hypothetical protein